MRFSFTAKTICTAAFLALAFFIDTYGQPGPPPDPDAPFVTIVWTDLKGASVSNGLLTRTASGAASYSYGANSSNVLPAAQDGHIEFTVRSTTSNAYIVGFTTNSVISSSYINYGFRITNTTVASIEGATVTTLPACVTGDMMRIERIGTSIRYLKNGVLLRTVTAIAVDLRVKGLPYAVSNSVPAINSSFQHRIILNAAIIGTGGTSSTGSITLSPEGGVPPYTYTWSNGNTASSISGVAGGDYSVTVTDSRLITSSKTFNLRYKTNWIDPVGATISTGIVTKTGAVSGTTSGANTSNRLPPNTNGWFEFHVINNSSYTLGFSLNSSSVTGNILYGLTVNAVNGDGRITKLTSGTNTGLTNWFSGDILRVERAGNTINYYQNGIQISTTGPVDPALDLFVKGFVYNNDNTTPLVNSSFDAIPIPLATITRSSAVLPSSNISVLGKGGAEPYTYTWTPGNISGSALSKRATGSYILTISDAEQRSLTREYNLAHTAEWVSAYGVANTNGVWTKTGAAGLNAGAVAANISPANMNGWIEMVADINSAKMFGYTSNYGYTTGTFNHAFSIGANTRALVIYEGATAIPMGQFNHGDVLRIARQDAAINYYRNGVLIRTSANTASSPYKIKAILNNTGEVMPIVMTSFAPALIVKGDLRGTRPDLNGSINVIGSGRPMPLTYQWTKAGDAAFTAATASAVNLSQGSYTVAITDSSSQTVSKTYDLGFDPLWVNEVNVTQTDGTFMRTGANWDGGAVTTGKLAPNQDGWIEFPVRSNNIYIIGFSTTAAFGANDIFRGVYIHSTNGLGYAKESSALTSFGSFTEGDIFRVAREGGAVKYYRNGFLLRTTTTSASLTLQPKILLYSAVEPTPRITTSFPSPSEGNVPDMVEYLALKEIYDSLNGPYWTSRTNWPTTWPASMSHLQFGTWQGVTVTAGDVTGLSLPQNKLVGKTPSAIVDLKKLRNLNLSSNYLQGKVTALNLPELVTLQLENNRITELPNLTTETNAANLAISVQNNLLQFDDLEKNFTAGGAFPFASFTYSPQGDFGSDQFVTWSIGKSTDSLEVRTGGLNNRYQWQRRNADGTWSDMAGHSESYFFRQQVFLSDSGYYRLSVTNTKVPSITVYSKKIKLSIGPASSEDHQNAKAIPEALRITRGGVKPRATEQHLSFRLAEMEQGFSSNVFPAPPCLEGNYYVAFQFKYDLADDHQSRDWYADLALTLKHGTNELWTQSLGLQYKTNQTFIATVFHDQIISCDGNYSFVVTRKAESNAPAENIFLNVLLYKQVDEVFNPAASLTLNCNYRSDLKQTTLAWPTAAAGIREFDLEWVFIEDLELFTGSAAQAFDFKQPTRITTSASSYTHHLYYPTGKIWYRVRAVGVNKNFPDHRIPGNWFYSECAPISISNHELSKNWLAQTIFSQEGKYKKIMAYLDGTSRYRQTQTNLSTEETTVIAETFYDFEGRKSIDVLAAPSGNNLLTFRPGFNVFAATDPKIAARTSTTQQKFHYDNDNLENSILAATSGASNYYSPSNNLAVMHKSLLADAEGYVYNQVEYLNDGTGTVKKQSNAGKDFRIDGSHVGRYFYGAAAQEELVRLFGSNVGNASHYKKNLVVDANGQVAVSYLDQEGRVIASALAGEKPASVDPLSSYSSLDVTPVSVNIIYKNQKSDGSSVTTHKLLNTAPGTGYTFDYNLSAHAALLQEIGCVDCKYDVRISLTDANGELLSLGEIPGNESPDAFGFRKTITAEDCASSVNTAVSVHVTLPLIGDYTITKTVTAYELSFEQITSVVSQSEEVQTMINELRSSYQIEEGECDICTGAVQPECPEAESLITEAIDEVAALDCDNIRNNIILTLETEHAGDDSYTASEAEIQQHPRYCEYRLCAKNQDSDVFEKTLARIQNWSAAVSAGYSDLFSIDPFFNDANLSGFSARSNMQAKLGSIYIATIAFDSNGDGVQDGTYDLTGSLQQITDPSNTAYYITDNGMKSPGGVHVLYLDLMKRKNQMTVAQYNEQLDRNRWIMYRSFYLEAKRKTKLTITEYLSCVPAKQKLEATDQLNGLRTEEEIYQWGQDNNLDTLASVEDVEMSYYSIRSACLASISGADSTTISNHLKSYFDGNKKNFFKLIFVGDLSTNPQLIAITNILATYGCGLTEVAVVDPMSCISDTTISVSNKETGQRAQLASMTAMSDEEQTQKASGPASIEQTSVKKDLDDKIKNTQAGGNKEHHSQEVQAAMVEEDAALTERFSKSFATRNQTNTTQLFSAALVSTPPSLSEFNALVDFYNATRQNGPWTTSTGWSNATYNQPVSVDGWYGVIVDANGHVIQLNFSLNNIRGTIPESLGNLTYLKVFSVFTTTNGGATNNNQLAGPLPASIGSLSSLQSISLDGHAITGQVPAALFSIQSLLNVSLQRNYGLSIAATTAFNCPNLESIDLFLVPVPNLHSSFANLSKLKSIRLMNCGLQGLPAEFGQYFSDLTELYLAYNTGITSLPDYFRGPNASGNAMNSLQKLYIAELGLTVLPDHFGENWTSLTELYMWSNSLKTLPDYFRGANASGNGMNNLQILQFSYRQSTNGSPYGFTPLETLPVHFGENWTSLRILEMEYSKLLTLTPYFHGANSSGNGMNNLEILYLNNYSTNTRKLTSLPSDFAQNMTKLQKIQCTFHSIPFLPDHFFNSTVQGVGLKAIQEIYFSNNLITSLPATFGKDLATLKVLLLDNNKLTALTPYFSGITNLYNGMNVLTQLSLNSNNLGSLPINFGDNWTSLQYLTLQDNVLTSLPDHFHGANGSGNGLNNLINLYLGAAPIAPRTRSNLLTILPVHFGENLNQLLNLDIQYNQLTALPNYFQVTGSPANGMVKLTNLYLNDNQLPSLPVHFGRNLTTLRYLNLQHNVLTGLSDYFHGADAVLGNGMNGLQTLMLGYESRFYTLFYQSGRFNSTTYGNNLLFQQQINTLPASFGKNWSSLTTLYLAGCGISTLSEYFNGSSDAMRNVSVLYLNNNQLTQLPTNFGSQWTSLGELYLHKNSLTSLSDYFRGTIGASTGMANLRKLFLGNLYLNFDGGGNNLSSLPQNFAKGWALMEELHLEKNLLTVLPDNFNNNVSAAGSLVKLKYLFLQNNKLASLPDHFGENMLALLQLSVSNNLLESFTSSAAHYPKLQLAQIDGNKLNYFPAFWTLPELLDLDISKNLLTSTIDPAIPAKVTAFKCSENDLTFVDLLQVKKNFVGLPGYQSNHAYAPQHLVDAEKTVNAAPGTTVTLTAAVDRTIIAELGPAFVECTYQWYRRAPNGSTFTLTSGHTLTFTATQSLQGHQYFYTIRNTGATSLILNSRMQTLNVQMPVTYNICLEYDTANATYKSFTYNVDWNKEVEKCLANAAKEDSILVEFAIDRLLHEEAAIFYNQYKTNCLDNLNESLKYTYTNKEYQYTLFYYDQAGNLAQTVPPNGVAPLSNAQVTAFLNSGVKAQPAHGLITKYKYNTLNQPISQQTPDAGESHFWYNEKGQLKLSQNAKQSASEKYSFTKYDEQGRVTEVGEMAHTGGVTPLLNFISDFSFPEENVYSLTDVTSSHYDRARTNPILDGFIQENLLTRVSWTGVIQTGRADTVSTYFSYDIHGNIKCLVQEIPGLPAKRTDYVYDAVSGKVNFLMYQYGKADQLIHEYIYDGDNRLKEVFTSTDGFLWDKEAEYFYYLHRGLARVELGEYRIQGIDYYHTLQGWLKGMNMPYAGDPGEDGSGLSRVPKDVAAFTLGYHPGDYKSIGNTVVSVDVRDAMWTHAGGLWTSPGLYNGNIAWMETDLKNLGKTNGNPAAGVQAMLYRYDQLHRIVASRSLTAYNESTGFPARSTDGPYDENYTYDRNGNILTLQRRNEEAVLTDDFNYSYYSSTNRLQKVKSSAAQTYEYDAIGNLVRDNEQGASISWTPYGKIANLQKVGITVDFRYDASGNRIEKKVQNGTTAQTTRYVRDASQNILAVYTDTIATELNLYGSARLGSYVGGRKDGYRILGTKQYEISNHLGNILAVVTDNINMKPDSIWATVAKVNDYYPFGLDMPGRSLVGEEVENDPSSSQDDVAAYFPLDGAALDQSGNNMNGSITGAVPTTDNVQRESSAYAFDGNSYITLSNSRDSLSFIQNTAKFTISAYVRLNNLTARSVIFANHSTSTAKGFLFMYENIDATYGQRQLRFSTFKGVSGSVYTAKGAPTSIKDTDWHHVAVVGDGSVIRFYVDGVPDGAASAISYFSSGSSTANAMIGAAPNGAIPGPAMNGAIDEVHVFKRALSETDINKLAQRLPLSEETVSAPIASVDGSYRYGFNGKEKDDKAQFGETHYDYGFRIYNPNIARFLSVDPITKAYPMLTPYQFASNRPIDGVDLDGLEYLTYRIVVDKGEVAQIVLVKDYRNLPEERIKEYHGMGAAEFYKIFSQSFGPEGRGVKYIYEFKTGTGGNYSSLQQAQGEFKAVDINDYWAGDLWVARHELKYHGLFSGPGCITKYGQLQTSTWDLRDAYDFTHTPVDEVDYYAKIHDMDYMAVASEGYKGYIEDSRTMEADQAALNEWNSYLQRAGKQGYVDRFTKRAPSQEALQSANVGVYLFEVFVRYKIWKNEKLKSMGYDPNNSADLDKISIKDYKDVNAEDYKILKLVK